jgi:undecaprenyl-diphosphatase
MIEALGHIDAALRAWVVGHRVGPLDGAMWLLSALGRGGLLFVAIAAVVALSRRDWRGFLLTGVAILLTALLVDHAIKPVVGRERPFVAAPDVAVIGGKPDDASFPSGHAGNAFAGAVTLSRTVPRLAPLWWTLAAAVAYSRVYLGVHYPGDVITGGIVGALVGAAVVRAGRAWRQTDRSR